MEVSSKGYYLNNFVNRILLKKSHARQSDPQPEYRSYLSEREREVMKYICMEFTAQEIAQKLGSEPAYRRSHQGPVMEGSVQKYRRTDFFAVKNNLID